MTKPSPLASLQSVLTALDKASRANLSPDDLRTIYAIGMKVLEMKQKYQTQSEVPHV